MAGKLKRHRGFYEVAVSNIRLTRYATGATGPGGEREWAGEGWMKSRGRVISVVGRLLKPSDDYD
jgi:hypothetical protein